VKNLNETLALSTSWPRIRKKYLTLRRPRREAAVSKGEAEAFPRGYSRAYILRDSRFHSRSKNGVASLAYASSG